VMMSVPQCGSVGSYRALGSLATYRCSTDFISLLHPHAQSPAPHTVLPLAPSQSFWSQTSSPWC